MAQFRRLAQRLPSRHTLEIELRSRNSNPTCATTRLRTQNEEASLIIAMKKQSEGGLTKNRDIGHLGKHLIRITNFTSIVASVMPGDLFISEIQLAGYLDGVTIYHFRSDCGLARYLYKVEPVRSKEPLDIRLGVSFSDTLKRRKFPFFDFNDRC